MFSKRSRSSGSEAATAGEAHATTLVAPAMVAMDEAGDTLVDSVARAPTRAGVEEWRVDAEDVYEIDYCGLKRSAVIREVCDDGTVRVDTYPLGALWKDVDDAAHAPLFVPPCAIAARIDGAPADAIDMPAAPCGTHIPDLHRNDVTPMAVAAAGVGEEGALDASGAHALTSNKQVAFGGVEEVPAAGEDRLTIPERLAAVNTAAGTFGAIIAASLRESCPQQLSGRLFTAHESTELRVCYEVLVDNLAFGFRSPAPPELSAPRALARFQHACKMALMRLVGGASATGRHDGVSIPIATCETFLDGIRMTTVHSLDLSKPRTIGRRDFGNDIAMASASRSGNHNRMTSRVQAIFFGMIHEGRLLWRTLAQPAGLR